MVNLRVLKFSQPLCRKFHADFMHFITMLSVCLFVYVIAFAEEVMFLNLFVCLFVSQFVCWVAEFMRYSGQNIIIIIMAWKTFKWCLFVSSKRLSF